MAGKVKNVRASSACQWFFVVAKAEDSGWFGYPPEFMDLDVGDSGVLHCGVGQVAPDQARSGEVGPGEVGPAEVGPGEVGPAEVGPGEVGPAEVGPAEVSTGDRLIDDLPDQPPLGIEPGALVDDRSP